MLRRPAGRPIPGRKRWWLLALFGLLVIGSDRSAGPPRLAGRSPLSLADPRLAPLRTAAARWESRTGRRRAVVDQVCLVPDMAGFFEAVAGWDRAHFYPILIEDAESTLCFLRAFRPARVIRQARPAPPIKSGKLWATALAAVRRSWREAEDRDSPAPGSARDVRPPASLCPTPPGLVLSNPGSPMLVGGVALAAGRFQPLVRCDAAGDDRAAASLAEFRQFDDDVTRAVTATVPASLGLGDDCDFLTLAGNYPFRYRDVRGEVEAVDDALGRTATDERWAYAGRLIGDPAASVYRAMCSLFLQPEAATWFNGYDEAAEPWGSYSTRGASARLGGSIATATWQAGDRSATVADWYEAFAPQNRSGLVWINSHGTPTVFHLQGDEPAATGDVPRTVPCAVVMIHSFSAADPTDPATIAGRWLANGAFVYYGSINEPYLQAFRTPQLAGELIAEHFPLAAALRATAVEPFGAPWRLAYLGDPLYQIAPRPPGVQPERTTPDAVADGFAIVHPAAASSPAGDAQATPPPEVVLRDGLDAAILLASGIRAPTEDLTLSELITRLLDLDRDTLRDAARRTLDAVAADFLFANRRRAELRLRIEAIPSAERSGEQDRWLDAIRSADFAWLVAGDDFDRIVEAWRRIVRSDAPSDTRDQATARVAARADDPGRRVAWAAALRDMLGNGASIPANCHLADELGKVEAAIQLDRRGGKAAR